jgi:hypothetical protein
MPGIFKKIKSLLGFVADKAPFLNYIVPGLGSLVSAGAKGAIHIGEGINKIHTDYTNAKKSKKKYSFFDGVKSGIEGATQSYKKEPVKISEITNSINQLSDRIKLKSGGT